MINVYSSLKEYSYNKNKEKYQFKLYLCFRRQILTNYSKVWLLFIMNNATWRLRRIPTVGKSLVTAQNICVEDPHHAISILTLCVFNTALIGLLWLIYCCGVYTVYHNDLLNRQQYSFLNSTFIYFVHCFMNIKR